MVWDELTGNLEVIWGALVALVVVVLLTPAVGGMARLLGVVDRSEGGRRPSAGTVPKRSPLGRFDPTTLAAWAMSSNSSADPAR